MDRNVKKYLVDILEAIESIYSYFGGEIDYSLYSQKKSIRRAVEREVEIIGEAMNRIVKLQPEIKITSAVKIIDQRNFIIHAYDSIDDKLIWDVLENHMPLLKKEAAQLLSEGSSNTE